MKHKGTITLETGRLILRRFALDDADAMYRNWANDPETSKFLTWPPHKTIDVTRVVIANWVSGYENSDKYEWAIELKSLGEPIGSIDAMKLNEKVRSVEVGYCIGKTWWHSGYVAEALIAVVKFLFEEVGVNRINAIHDPNNPNSGAVMRKSGFTFETFRRQAGWNNQGVCDHCEYVFLAEDYFGKANKIRSPEVAPGTYRHYKGNHYEVIGIAKHSETLEDVVVYKALYGEFGLWVRPASMWSELVEVDGVAVKRFERVSD
jgi:ribosomal-protein-alanine N-acetyltransferase